MRRNVRWLLAALVLCGGLIQVVNGADTQPVVRHWLPAFDAGDTDGTVWHKGQGTRRYPFLHLGHIYSQCLRPSPDGKFMAVLLAGEADAAQLVVFRWRSGEHFPRRRDVVSRTFADAHGCAWVPQHPHLLAFSTGGADYGIGMLGLWTQPYHVHLLRHARSAAGEGFHIRRVSTDGAWLDYEHFGRNDPEPDSRRIILIDERVTQRY